MKITPISLPLTDFPADYRPLLTGASLFDSSSSPEARVCRIDQPSGSSIYLKRAAAGSLMAEARMDAYFHSLGLAPAVLDYRSEGGLDYLLTEQAVGRDCTEEVYLSAPERLCDTLADILRMLHSLPTEGCPVQDRIRPMLSLAEKNYSEGRFDLGFYSHYGASKDVRSVWCELQKRSNLLRPEALCHGDFCLPNILLDGWKLGSFIDLGNAGVGDRHQDIFWAIWTLEYNLHTDRLRDRLLDAYGRERVDPERLRTVAMLEVFG